MNIEFFQSVHISSLFFVWVTLITSIGTIKWLLYKKIFSKNCFTNANFEVAEMSFTFGKRFLISPVYFLLRWKFHCLNIQTVELTDIKKTSLETLYVRHNKLDFTMANSSCLQLPTFFLKLRMFISFHIPLFVFYS